jgi:hypothetical protein
MAHFNIHSAATRRGQRTAGLRRRVTDRRRPQTAPLSEFFLKIRVFFSEPLDAPRRVHQLLFTGEKRMALGADLHVDIRFGGACLQDVTAGAPDLRLMEFGMDTAFHDRFPLLSDMLFLDSAPCRDLPGAPAGLAAAILRPLYTG